MKVKNKIISAIAAGTLTLASLVGAMPGIVPDMGDSLTASAAAQSDKLFDKTSGLYYYKYDENEDGIYDRVTIANDVPGLNSPDKSKTNYYGITKLVIPSEIEGLPVTSIAPDAFFLCFSLTDVTVPESVTFIGGSAFESCEALKCVTIKNPECEIAGESSIISNRYTANGRDREFYYDGTIKGYAGSTAQAYAEKYGYKFKALDESGTDYEKGDANHDGFVNVRDAAVIAKALADHKGDTLPESADYDENGSINVRDAAMIARHLAETK